MRTQSAKMLYDWLLLCPTFLTKAYTHRSRMVRIQSTEICCFTDLGQAVPLDPTSVERAWKHLILMWFLKNFLSNFLFYHECILFSMSFLIISAELESWLVDVCNPNCLNRQFNYGWYHKKTLKAVTKY